MTNQAFQQDSFQATSELNGILVGNRVPKDYFVTKGTGQSNITVHAGSYHLALQQAGIERYNIMTYSSILPGIANRIEKPAQMTHGSVMESIMAVCTAEKGERATAGIIYGWLYDRETNEKYGGLVCENYGNFSETDIGNLLRASIDELYYNGFSDQYNLTDISLFTESFVPEKKYGTALVALCFTNYVYPLINS